jgi:hypothetical protein
MCVLNVHETNIFCGVCKKRKFILKKALFLALSFVFLHTSHDKSIFMKLLCECVAREDLRAIFSFNFFKIQNICKTHFKIEETCSHVQRLTTYYLDIACPSSQKEHLDSAS